MCKVDTPVNTRVNKKSFWEKKLSFRTTVRQDTHLVFIELSKEKKLPLTRVVELLIKESPLFKEKMQELKEEGFFDF